MSVLAADDARALREVLGRRLSGEVELQHVARLAGDPVALFDETARLLAELQDLDPRIRVASIGAAPGEEAPQIRIGGRAGGRVRYLGAPAGYEFGSLLDAVLLASNGDAALQEGSRAALRRLRREVRLQVFVTPGCPSCPPVVDLAQRLAIESDRVTTDVIAADEFPALADRYRVRGVPCVVVGGERAFVGGQSEARFVARVARAGAVGLVG
jgi:glutaredoxin-like protein